MRSWPRYVEGWEYSQTITAEMLSEALHDAGEVPDDGHDPFIPLVYIRERGGAFGLDRTGLTQVGIATAGFDTQVDWVDKPVPAGLPAFPGLDGTWQE